MTERELTLLMAAAMYANDWPMLRAIQEAETLISEYDRTHKQE